METDYISRKAFIEQKERQYCQNCDRRKNSKGKVVYEIGGPPCRACGIGDMLDDVEDFPAADVRPVKEGHWLTWEEMFPDQNPRRKNNLGVFCSACKKHADNMTDYCPNCGAMMGGTP